MKNSTGILKKSMCALKDFVNADPCAALDFLFENTSCIMERKEMEINEETKQCACEHAFIKC